MLMQAHLRAMPFFFFMLPFFYSVHTSAQQKILWDKPGAFKIVNNGIYQGSSDIEGKRVVHSKTEADSHYKNLISIIDIFRSTPVLSQTKGFDGIAMLENTGHNLKFDYPIPCRIKFLFETWFENKGKTYKHINEPPQWFLTINKTNYYVSNGTFNVSTWDSYNPNNPLYSQQKAEKATLALRELFWSPGKKENIAYGIDKYNDQYIIYNPERPPYWLPVTIREVFKLYRNYYQIAPDTVMAKAMLNTLQSEYEGFTEAELDGYAYAKGGESIFGIGTANEMLKPVMRANPDYWNRSFLHLPFSLW
jgi:hypothetical protein